MAKDKIFKYVLRQSPTLKVTMYSPEYLINGKPVNKSKKSDHWTMYCSHCGKRTLHLGTDMLGPGGRKIGTQLTCPCKAGDKRRYRRAS